MKKILLTIIMLTNFIMYPSENRINKYIDPDMIKEAGSPIFSKNGVIITLPPEVGYQIFIRSDLDGWKKNYYFKRSFFGIFYCMLDYDSEKKVIAYKVNINGFWDINPMGGPVSIDAHGNPFSLLYYPDEIKYNLDSPIIKEVDGPGKLVIFRFNAPNAKQVSLVFSGSKYSRFTNQMIKKEKGYWEIELLVEKGAYFYYFQVDDIKYIDKENSNLIDDSILGPLSTVVVK
ncbi:MAG: hypothetical protein A2015_01075 [Spirochaetes bacterium GWF1_31_7]|nr:MAG: hypothetical protein A2Y30_00975 [Spirochaetes bacterium GWE1_32_154]OHD47891.1 MAG: hypothetical protein A2015_01075 [Spirochaetes bacterium GWF1_31_7]OHD48882.1 MAG: hypothetical protein A2Y29_16790 [Spirochaetes bacterium GWE2_31_10]HBD96515.1 hypothetical protein [Spirochaetia bacterium]HBI38091.1 hypothetical protein [Spirochaetia bacterium]